MPLPVVNLYNISIYIYIEQFYTNIEHKALLDNLRQVVNEIFEWQLALVPDNVKNRGQARFDGSRLYLVVREKRLKIAHKWEFLTPAKANIRNSGRHTVLHGRKSHGFG